MRSRAGWREMRDRLLGSDPGLARLRLARDAVVGVASTLAVEWVFATLRGTAGAGRLVAMMLGAMIAMMGSSGLSGMPSRREQVLTAAFFPVAMGLGLALAAGLTGHRIAQLALFVGTMFAAVFVRRFGPAFFFYGFMSWMGYFFAMFLGVGLAAVGGLVLAATVASGWMLLVATTVLRGRPERTAVHMIAAFHARARAVATAAANALREPANLRLRHRMGSRLVRLTEAALMIEAQLGEPEMTNAGLPAAALRRWVVDCELAVVGVARAATSLAARPPGRRTLVAARALLAAMVTADEAAARAAHAAQAHGECDDPALRSLGRAVLRYLELARQRPGGRDVEGSFHAAVSFQLGNLPTSTTTARDVPPRLAGGHLLGDLSLTTRQAIQVALAGALAIVGGELISGRRYYWAVIAAFVVFTGTGTRTDAAVKAIGRTTGTLAGLGAGILLANATAGHTLLALGAILASIFCGFYLQRLSYSYLIFFITIMIGQLYSMLGMFTDQLMVLRLEETGLGAAAGVLVSVFVLPVSTRDAARIAQAGFYQALRELLTAAADAAQGRPSGDLDAAARKLDAQLHQVIQVITPLTRRYLPGADSVGTHHRIAMYAAIATDARAIAATLRGVGPVEANGLAEGLRDLAAAVGPLAGEDDTPELPAARLAAARSTLARSAALDDTVAAQAADRLVLALSRLEGPPLTAVTALEEARSGALLEH